YRMEACDDDQVPLLLDGKFCGVGGTKKRPPGGGGAPAAPVSIDSAEVYDAANGVFRTAGGLRTARDSHSATLLANGTVLVAGGYTHGFDGDAQPYWDTMFATELFNPVTSVSTAAAILEQDRAEHVAITLTDGEVLITGGISGFLEPIFRPKPVIVLLSSAEVYK